MLRKQEDIFAPPPFGPNPGWTKTPYAEKAWVVERPGSYSMSLDFEKFPDGYRYFAKHFLWALEFVTDPRAGRLAITKSASFINYYYNLRWIAEYLHQKGVARLSALSMHEIRSMFFEHIGGRVTSENTINRTSYAAIISAYHKLYSLGPFGVGTLPDGFIYELRYGELPANVKLRESDQTALMPERVARDLLNTSIDLVSKAKYITRLFRMQREVCYDAATGNKIEGRLRRPAWYAYSRSSSLRRRSLNEALTALDPYLSMIAEPPRKRRGRRLLALDKISLTTIDTLAEMLIAACYSVLAGFTGFRYSEIVTMTVGDVVSQGGKTRISSRIFKTTAVIGGMKVDRAAPEIVQIAFEALVEFARVRDRSSKLWLSPRLGEISVGDLNRVLTRFCAVTCGAVWNVKTHQFRRFFAIFFVRRFKGGRDALSWHFGHVSFEMIEYYIADPQAMVFLAEAEKGLMDEILTSIVYGEGKYVVPHANALVRPIGHAPTIPIESLERQLLKWKGDFHRIRAHPYGYCLVQPDNYEGAMCAGAGGIPDPVDMCPTNCLRCRHFVIGEENIDFWRNTISTHREVADSPHTPALAARLSRQFIDEIRTVIDAQGLLSG